MFTTFIFYLKPTFQNWPIHHCNDLFNEQQAGLKSHNPGSYKVQSTYLTTFGTLRHPSVKSLSFGNPPTHF